MESKLLYEKESYLVRGASFGVYSNFGGAFKESVVQNAFVEELRHLGLKVETQKRINIYYRGKAVGIYVPDIIVENKILIEIKTKSFLTREDERQFWRYLRGSEYKLGFLINFGTRKLEIKRRIYDKARHDNKQSA